jgi:hypothetical protein
MSVTNVLDFLLNEGHKVQGKEGKAVLVLN